MPCLEGLTGEALLHSVADKLAALTERGVAFDGLAASSDALAVAALKALTAAGVKVPESVQVVGYDHTDLSLACTPALTTVDTCAEEMCRRCVDTMMDVLAGREAARETLLTPPAHPPGNHATSKKGGIPLQRQAVLFDLGWTLVVPRSGDWMLTPLFRANLPRLAGGHLPGGDGTGAAAARRLPGGKPPPHHPNPGGCPGFDPSGTSSWGRRSPPWA